MFNNKKILILGIARSGIASAKLLINMNNEVIINDIKEIPEKDELERLGCKVIIGSHPDDLIDSSINYVIKSPGIRNDHKLVLKAIELGIPVINEVELAYNLIPKDVTIIGITGIVLGSNFVVDSASTIATIMGVSERLISLTIIALGTSLPELVTSMTATKKGEYDIAIGNVVGSNIFNIGMVIGIPVTVFGGIGIINFSYIDLIVMIVASVLLFIFSFNDYKISRKEGILFLILFVTYYSYVLIS